VVAWALFEIYPPTNRDLIQVFRENARGADENFSKIVERAQTLSKNPTNSAYASLIEAIGTNDISTYFPQYTKLTLTHPTTSILNAIQREAMGRIHLGIDLQGGTSFLVEMNTNNLVHVVTTTNKWAWLNPSPTTSISPAPSSQAVEVLRKRVDQFGVAEPVIQAEGYNRISIQLARSFRR